MINTNIKDYIGGIIIWTLCDIFCITMAILNVKLWDKSFLLSLASMGIVFIILYTITIIYLKRKEKNNKKHIDNFI